MAQAKTEEKKDFKGDLIAMRGQMEQRKMNFEAMLPSHYTVEKFFGIIERACMKTPELLYADRLSFFEAALAAAEDGLPPDGRRGAMVIYRTNIAKRNQPEVWIDKVQWLPMIRGIIEKLYNTGKVKSALAREVYKNDTVRLWTDDAGEHISHESMLNAERGPIVGYYAAVFMQDGSVFAEQMTPGDVAKIRAASKMAQSGPWKEWTDEMAKKSVFKRLAKRLPMSIEIERMMTRDDEYFLNSLKNITPGEEQAERPKGIANRLNALADNRGMGNVDLGNPVQERQPEPERRQQEDRKPAQTQQQTQKQADPVPMDVDGAYDRGIADKAAGKASMAMPKEYRQKEDLAKAWQRGYRGEDNPAADDNDNSDNGDDS